MRKVRLRYIISKLLEVFERAAAGVQEDERTFVTGLQVRIGRFFLRLVLQSVYVYWQVFALSLHPDIGIVWPMVYSSASGRFISFFS